MTVSTPSQPSAAIIAQLASNPATVQAWQSNSSNFRYWIEAAQDTAYSANGLRLAALAYLATLGRQTAPQAPQQAEAAQAVESTRSAVEAAHKPAQAATVPNTVWRALYGSRVIPSFGYHVEQTPHAKQVQYRKQRDTSRTWREDRHPYDRAAILECGYDAEQGVGFYAIDDDTAGGSVITAAIDALSAFPVIVTPSTSGKKRHLLFRSAMRLLSVNHKTDTGGIVEVMASTDNRHITLSDRIILGAQYLTAPVVMDEQQTLALFAALGIPATRYEDAPQQAEAPRPARQYGSDDASSIRKFCDENTPQDVLSARGGSLDRRNRRGESWHCPCGVHKGESGSLNIVPSKGGYGSYSVFVNNDNCLLSRGSGRMVDAFHIARTLDGLTEKEAIERYGLRSALSSGNTPAPKRSAQRLPPAAIERTTDKQAEAPSKDRVAAHRQHRAELAARGPEQVSAALVEAITADPRLTASERMSGLYLLSLTEHGKLKATNAQLAEGRRLSESQMARHIYKLRKAGYFTRTGGRSGDVNSPAVIVWAMTPPSPTAELVTCNIGKHGGVNVPVEMGIDDALGTAVLPLPDAIMLTLYNIYKISEQQEEQPQEKNKQAADLLPVEAVAVEAVAVEDAEQCAYYDPALALPRRERGASMARLADWERPAEARTAGTYNPEHFRLTAPAEAPAEDKQPRNAYFSFVAPVLKLIEGGRAATAKTAKPQATGGIPYWKRRKYRAAKQERMKFTTPKERTPKERKPRKQKQPAELVLFAAATLHQQPRGGAESVSGKRPPRTSQDCRYTSPARRSAAIVAKP